MTSLSHQAAEALIKACDDPERNRYDLTKEQATEQIALIIAKVTGCDEMTKDKERLDALEKAAKADAATDYGYDVMISGPGNHGGDPDHYLITVEAVEKIRPFLEASGPTLREAIDSAFLSRLQPQAPTNRNPAE